VSDSYTNLVIQDEFIKFLLAIKLNLTSTMFDVRAAVRSADSSILGLCFPGFAALTPGLYAGIRSADSLRFDSSDVLMVLGED
jgi:hypothetical protein